MSNGSISEVGAPLPIGSTKPGPVPPAPHQAIDPSQFKPMTSPTTIFRGDAGMHSPDFGFEESGQVDVRLPFSGRIV
jgi:hypothetical protein